MCTNECRVLVAQVSSQQVPILCAHNFVAEFDERSGACVYVCSSRSATPDKASESDRRRCNLLKVTMI